MAKMKSFGATFRLLREQKNMTVTETAAGIMSKQGLSSFEIGRTSITLDLLYPLLKKLHLSMEEFIYFYDFDDSHHKVIIELQNLYQKNDVEKLRQYTDNLLNQYHLSGNIEYKHSYIIARRLIARINQSPDNPSDDDKNCIKHFLLKSETWGIYEFELFTNTIDLFDSEELELLSQIAFKHTQQVVAITKFTEHEMTYLAFNIISRLFDLYDFKEMDRYFEFIHEQIEANDLYASFLLKYYKSLHDYFSTPSQDSTICWSYVDMLNVLDNQDLYKLYAQDLKQREQQKLEHTAWSEFTTK